MSNQSASILVIAPFKDNERMYPHLHDIIVNLREQYDEVIYVEDSMQCKQRADIDKLQHQLNHTEPPAERRAIQHQLDEQSRLFIETRTLFVEKLARTIIRNRRYLVLAVDDNAFNCSIEAFPEATTYWSFDPIGKDSLHRSYNHGLIEQLLRENSQQVSRARAMIVQDVVRGEYLQYCLDARFSNILYVPVALNDSRFCRISSLKRLQGITPERIKVLQCGYIWSGRYSDELLRSYEKWPSNYELHLKGDIGLDILPFLQQCGRYVHVSPVFHDNKTLPIILNDYDVGFIGYRESDKNHQMIVNASSQLVIFLRLGIPVICSGSGQLIEFVNKHEIGIGIDSPTEINGQHFTELTDKYTFFSGNARKLYEDIYDLRKIMGCEFYAQIDTLMRLRELV